MLYQAVQYIKFLLNSTNQHGVHSPFVYNLITKCFYDTKPYSGYKGIYHYKKALLKNKSVIAVTDLGAGSQIMKYKNRCISKIAKNAGTTNKRAKLLFRLMQYLKPKNILELGTSLGIATNAMSLGSKKSSITSVEGCSNIYKFSENFLNQNSIKNTLLINGDFSNEIKKLTSNTYDLIFFDGNHQKHSTLHYFESLLDTAHNNSLFIFDDIYWSKEMTEAWDIIKQHPKVTVTIDTFFWGFVFFRTKQAKEHFKVRI